MSNQTWSIDHTHSGIHFSVRHLVVAKVRGTFPKWEAKVTVDESDLTRSQLDVEVDVASVDTGLEQRDNHLRSADFFDVEHHPKMTFKSKRIERAGEDRYKVTGDLTIRGTTREVTLDVTDEGRTKDPWGGTRAGFTAHTSVDRRDFGLTWNIMLEAGGVTVGDKVNIEVEIEAITRAAAPAKEANA